MTGKTERFFVEPRGNMQQTNKAIAEFLEFDHNAPQTWVWCTGLTAPKLMWEASLADCQALTQSNHSVAIWKIDRPGARAERVRWLTSASTSRASPKKRTPRSKGPILF